MTEDDVKVTVNVIGGLEEVNGKVSEVGDDWISG